MSFAASSATQHAHAQTASDDNLGSQITHNGGDNFTFRFWGASGWTAFPQVSTDLESWTYAGQLAPGSDSIIQFGITANLPNYGDAIFARLKLSDIPTTNAWLADFDGDSFKNQVELDMGTDPLDATDDDLNGIPDDIDAYWATVESSWKTAIVNDINAAYYDPDGLITSEADILPNGDYDGDSISNAEEYVNGTDATDFFNGNQSVFPQVLSGDNETAPPNAYLIPDVAVAIYNLDNEALIGAPVIYSTTGAYLSEDQSVSTPLTTTYRTVTTVADGAKVAFFTPSTTGTTTVTASFPNGMSLDIDVITVSAASFAKQPLRQFELVENQDGTTTYTWISDADSGDWFRIQDNQPDSTWETMYETTYGSSELPFVSGLNTYTVTLDADNNYVSN